MIFAPPGLESEILCFVSKLDMESNRNEPRFARRVLKSGVLGAELPADRLKSDAMSLKCGSPGQIALRILWKRVALLPNSNHLFV